MFHIELRGPKTVSKCICSCCGNEHKMEEEGELLYETKIAYSFKTVCRKVSDGFYTAIWGPNVNRQRIAGGLIRTLHVGVVQLRRERKDMYRYMIPGSFNSYNLLIKTIENYIEACKTYPKAKIITYEMSKPEM